MGRITKEPEIKVGTTSVAKYSLAVDRKFKQEGQPSADFINCVAFGKQAEFSEKYLKKGTKIVVTGRIQTGSYTNRDGNKVYTTDVVVEEQEFAESKNVNQGETNTQPTPQPTPMQGTLDFVNVEDAIGTDELPFD